MMRDKLAETIMANRAVDNWGEPTPADLDLADDIIAALPGMVPDLVWDGPYPACGFKRGRWNSGDCTVVRKSEEYWRVYYNRIDEIDAIYPTAEAAQAAANDHHRNAIMQALGVES